MINTSDLDLSTLPSVLLKDRSQLPEASAVYIAIDSQSTVLYIGATTNLKKRWTHHKMIGQGVSSILYLEVDPSDLIVTEKRLILRFNPPFNKMLQHSFFGEKDRSPKVILPDGFGWKMRMARFQKQLKQYQVSGAARMSGSQLSQIERGRVKVISVWKLRQIESALGVDFGVKFND